MTPKTFFATSMTAVLLSTSTLAAQTANDAVNDAIAELQGAGYSQIEVRIRNGGFRIEATGANGTVEQTFDADGNLIREELVAGGIETETTYDAEGNVVSSETGPSEEADDEDEDTDEDDEDSDEDEDEDDDDSDDD